jgi:hypothetical protein
MQQFQQHVMNMATTAPPQPQYQHQRPPQGHTGRGGRPRNCQLRYSPPAQQYQPAPGYQPSAVPGGYQQPRQQQYRNPAPPAQRPYRALPPTQGPTMPPPYGHAQGPPPHQAWPAIQPPPMHHHPTTKRYANMNYCWTHGYDIDDQHTGMLCKCPAAYHQPQATQQNPMGGSQKDVQKILMGQPPDK